MDQLLSELTFWHWLAIGLVAFGFEMMTGTFDLLMIAIAAWATSAFTYFAPETMTTWQGQLIFFGAAAAILIVFGRTVLSGMRQNEKEHPTLNRRMAQLVGQHGTATQDFTGGTGQVKIGDTVWGAESAAEEPIRDGDTVIVESTRQNSAIVRKLA